jgi:hypothetical protein
MANREKVREGGLQSIGGGVRSVYPLYVDTT